MRQFKNETLIIGKDSWKFLRNYKRAEGGYKPLTEEQQERIWNRIELKNGGASSKKFPISEDEIRISIDSFGYSIQKVIRILSEHGFTSYRNDGFIEEGIYVSL